MQSSMNLRRALALPRLRLAVPTLTRSALAIAAAMLLTVGVYALVLYLSLSAQQDRAAARARLSDLRAERRDVESSAPGLRTAEADHAAAQRAVDEHGRGMVGSAEHVVLVDRLAGLARRSGVELQALTLDDTDATETGALSAAGLAGLTAANRPPQPQKPAPAKTAEAEPYVTVPVSMEVRGGGPAVADFIDTLQSGMVPGLAITQAYLKTEDGLTLANLSLRIHAWPTTSQTLTLPAPLQAIGAPATSVPTASVDGGGAALLAWGVRGRAAWTDNLIGVTLRSNAADGRVTSFRLYAETSGDGRPEPSSDTLLASAAPGADGVAVLNPAVPFPFRADTGLRLYVTAEVSPTAPVNGSLDVWLAPGDVLYTSMAWPAAPDGGGYHGGPTLQPDP